MELAKDFPIIFLIKLLILSSISSSLITNKCIHEIDSFNCLNINCNGKKNLIKLPHKLDDLIAYNLKNNELICSLDITDTGITEISTETIGNLNPIFRNFIKLNPQQEQTNLIISFSNLIQINKVDLDPNIVIYIYDSNIRFIEPKCFDNKQLQLNLINVSFSMLNWMHLMHKANFKLLNLRNLQLHKANNYNLETTSVVTDLKIYNSNIPILDDQYPLFRLINSIEQLELINCSISSIKHTILNKYKSLKYLSLSSNNLNKISDNLFVNLENLEYLDLDDNPLEYIHPNAFKSLKNLKFISINFFKSSRQASSSHQWFFNLLKLNLNELNFKTNKLLNNFCLLNQIVNFLNKFNRDLFEKYEQFNIMNKEYSMVNERRLRLFSHDEITIDLNRLSSNKILYCSVYFVCKYLKNYTHSYFNAWTIEYFDVCAQILTIHDNNEFICAINDRIQECRKISVPSPESSIRERYQQNSLEKQFSLMTIFTKFSFIIMFISFLIFIIFIALICFLIVSYIRKKFLFKDKKSRRVPRKFTSLESRAQWFNDSFDSNYYVVLVNKKHVKI
ncbi:unnamed protein product [Brachionus calyciflorus]|uniref:Uncharacterized protein n=1 Tax=Brachionus calyciflorus TaxID=104777 RepID=A0A813Y7R8_9BILA|nr:unnamed protein product [Brachionus calyciflorus]